MKLNLKGAFKNLKRDIGTIKKKVSDGERTNVILDDLEIFRNDMEFLHEQLMEFYIETRDRKKEGEKVIDELIDVLCLKDV